MEKLIVTSSPHVKSSTTTSTIMRDVIIALIPALIASNIIFGLRAGLVTAVCVASCVGFEYLSRRIMNKKNTISDLSAVVTGIILAFNLPSTMPLWMCVIGSFVAIVIVKQLFGGIGQNFANPAITARIVLLVSFGTQMTNWAAPKIAAVADAVSGATPMAQIAAGETPNLLNMFLGTTGGSLGETSALALLIGGIYLVYRKVINPIIPVAFIGTVFVFTAVLGVNPLAQILGGGLFLGAIFMATDYSTSPVTNMGKLIFGIGCGFITVLIRVFGSYPEGVSFAILLMNILVPYIDKATRLKALGGKR
ncbi:RnfABCDGE type electron transport complex subunit D [Clostridium sp. NSJ-49]|uniref:Ion-translocating oxidoreductase complex subunit D n=1 Tax=Clostridium disporicum TaxID=84024 RepID=A0A173ZB85_9CLOT|nr:MULTISPECIES: RnfABCDGE type electron transport complex subunit D [Clostridium]MBC5626255.1 RnfABCDGE type electron transport complex subunit D [Clostridium sp. NSJ-49]MCD2502677.1 RnfABCDGE type electron transport complex subunit D [Clostridium sp. NSJ-145]CUN72930.1 RnfABCDGE type electron transport complex subunit D [Clostridium disporicum]